MTEETSPGMQTQHLNPDSRVPTEPMMDLPEGGEKPPLASTVLIIVLLLIVGGLIGIAAFLGGRSYEGEQANNTIEAITEIAADSLRATAAVQRTQTAVIEGYTATPTTTFTPTATRTPSIPVGQMQVFSSPLRSGPGTEFPAVGNVNQGQQFAVTGVSEDGEWLYITVNLEGLQGFVAADRVRLLAGSPQMIPVVALPSATPTDLPPPSATASLIPTQLPSPVVPQARVIALSSVVRSGPAESYETLTTLPQGSTVLVTGISEDGSHIQIRVLSTQGILVTGFVRTDEFQLTAGSLSGVAIAAYPTQTPEPSVTPTFTHTPLPTSTVTPSATLLPSTATLSPTPSVPMVSASGQVLVVREGPGEAFNAVGLVDAGDSLEVTGLSPDGAWYRVQYGDETGWVSAQVVFTAGNFANVEVIENVPSATPVAAEPDRTNETPVPPDMPDSDTSAGALDEIVPTQLPEEFVIDYEQLPDVQNYAYQWRIVVQGESDGEPVFGVFHLIYARSENAERVYFDVSGALLPLLGDDTEIVELLPLILGISGEEAYMVLPPDGDVSEAYCAALGNRPSLSTTVESVQIFDEQVIRSAARLNELTVSGVIDRNGLVGIPGVHYQVLGQGTPEDFTPTESLKVDFWLTPDETILYGYRLLISTDRAALLAEIGITELLPVDNFQGNLTIELLPLAINEQVESLTTVPDECQGVIAE